MAAASALQLYAKNLNVMKLSDLTTASLKLLLATSIYSPNTGEAGQSALAEVTNEIAAGNGYSAGGIALATPAVTAIAGGYKFSTGNASVLASGTGIPVWRYGVLYVAGALWGITSPLIGVFTADATPADAAATAAGVTLQIACPANGWFTNLRT